MKKYNHIVSCLFVLCDLVLMAACGNLGSGNPTDPPTAGTVYVDSSIQSNGDGTKDNPYSTLSLAISNMEEGKSYPIHLAYGVYDINSGETFPLTIPANITVLGQNPLNIDSGKYVLIRGAGAFYSDYLPGEKQVAVVLKENTEIDNVIIESEDGVALWHEDGEKVDVNNCVIQNNSVGIVSAGNSSMSILKTKIQNNTNAGIELYNNAKPTFILNEVSNNNIGIIILDEARPQFGTSQTDGANILMGNQMCDLQHLGEADLITFGTTWDNDPFDFSIEDICIDGTNISNEASGSITYQYVPPTNIPIFAGTSRIQLYEPINGILLFNDTPNFVWTSTGARETILVIWDFPPNLSQAESLEEKGICWVWHSGMGKGFPGSVFFEDGKSSVDGTIDNLTDPDPLKNGRAYYWAVWEWDDKGVDIVASSDLQYFRVAN